MKTTIRFLILMVFLGDFFFANAQERKIRLSMHAGWSVNGVREYANEQLGYTVGGDVSYFLTDKFFLTAHFNYAANDIYDDIHTKTPNIAIRLEDHTNATLMLNNIGLLAGYRQSVTLWANVEGQIGVSQSIEVSHHFPVYVLYSDDASKSLENFDYTLFTMSFPVKFNVGFTPFKQMKNIEIGYTLGFYISPDFGFFTGVYHGPQLNISF